MPHRKTKHRKLASHLYTKMGNLTFEGFKHKYKHHSKKEYRKYIAAKTHGHKYVHPHKRR